MEVTERPQDKKLFAYSIGFKRKNALPQKAISKALMQSLEAYQEQRELDREVGSWYECEVPAPTVAPDELSRLLI